MLLISKYSTEEFSVFICLQESSLWIGNKKKQILHSLYWSSTQDLNFINDNYRALLCLINALQLYNLFIFYCAFLECFTAKLCFWHLIQSKFPNRLLPLRAHLAAFPFHLTKSNLLQCRGFIFEQMATFTNTSFGSKPAKFEDFFFFLFLHNCCIRPKTRIIGF